MVQRNNKGGPDMATIKRPIFYHGQSGGGKTTCTFTDSLRGPNQFFLGGGGGAEL